MPIRKISTGYSSGDTRRPPCVDEHTTIRQALPLGFLNTLIPTNHTNLYFFFFIFVFQLQHLKKLSFSIPNSVGLSHHLSISLADPTDTLSLRSPPPPPPLFLPPSPSSETYPVSLHSSRAGLWMSLSRSPSPQRGGGWSTPGLTEPSTPNLPWAPAKLQRSLFSTTGKMNLQGWRSANPKGKFSNFRKRTDDLTWSDVNQFLKRSALRLKNRVVLLVVLVTVYILFYVTRMFFVLPIPGSLPFRFHNCVALFLTLNLFSCLPILESKPVPRRRQQVCADISLKSWGRCHGVERPA